MKKTLMGIALLAIGAVPFAAGAQNPANCGTPCNTTCQAPCDSANCRPDKKCGPDACLFSGIELTDDQKTRIADLDKGLRESRLELKEAEKKQEKTAKSDYRARSRDLRAKYLQGMSQILSPQQYTQYLENYYVNSPSQGRGFRKTEKVRNFDRKPERKNNGEGARMEKARKFDGKKYKGDK